MSVKTFVLYHAHCPDGFGAAFAAWCALGDAAEYLPVSYGEPMPEMPDGSRVFIVDFSWPDNARAREELCALSERCALVVLDHHKTAAEALRGLPFATFDLEKSGAVLAWEYFRDHVEPMPDAYGLREAVPELLLYIQDRDLWQWKLPQSREFSAGLALVPREFERWLGLIVIEGARHKDIIREGGVCLKRDKMLVDSICDRAHFRGVYVGAAKPLMQIPCVNTPILQSDCCHELLNRDPEARVVAAYYDKTTHQRVWSLRSRADFDCSRIAKANGGGGHAQAAGFEEEI